MSITLSGTPDPRAVMKQKGRGKGVLLEEEDTSPIIIGIPIYSEIKDIPEIRTPLH